MNILLLGFTLLGGAMLSAQSSINGAFSQKAGALESTFLTFFTGMLILALAILFFGQGNVLLLLEAPRWQLSAVLFGVSYLFLTILAVPQIGVSRQLVSRPSSVNSQQVWSLITSVRSVASSFRSTENVCLV